MKSIKPLRIGAKTAAVLRPLISVLFILLSAGGAYSLVAGGFPGIPGGILAGAVLLLMFVCGAAGLFVRRASVVSALAGALAVLLLVRLFFVIAGGGDLDLLLLLEAALAWVLASCAAARKE